MQPFQYLSVFDEPAAIEAAARARFLAGGTTLVDLLKLHVETPTALADINRLPLAEIEELPDGVVRVGALARNSDMAHHELIRDQYPVLSQAILAGGSGQIRNMATTGGNLMQRTRCSYFREPALACNKREPGSGCGAIDGYNRMHAILGGSEHCIATHPSDMCVARAALEAMIRVHGPGGERAIPFSRFYLLPGDHPEHEHAIEREELIVGVDIPPLPQASTVLKEHITSLGGDVADVVSCRSIVERSGSEPIEARTTVRPGSEQKRYSMHSFGAVFVEVEVDEDLGDVRVSRVVGAYGAGRIINAKTARSQMIGGITYGFSMALFEQTAIDHRSGRYLNADLSEYLVPVNADARAIDVLLVDEFDPFVDEIGLKGIGEIGTTGVAAAVANAVFHATGVRVRDLPITLDKLL